MKLDKDYSSNGWSRLVKGPGIVGTGAVYFVTPRAAMISEGQVLSGCIHFFPYDEFFNVMVQEEELFEEYLLEVEG